jgi:hypothetical protein
VLAVLTFWILDQTVYQKAKDKAEGRIPPPEERLYTSMLGSFGIPVALFWFAWTARTDIHWISPVLAGVPFGWGMSCLFVSSPFPTQPLIAHTNLAALAVQRRDLPCRYLRRPLCRIRHRSKWPPPVYLRRGVPLVHYPDV